MREKIKELQEENEKKGIKLDITIDCDKVKIGGRWQIWKEGMWNDYEEGGKEEEMRYKSIQDRIKLKKRQNEKEDTTRKQNTKAQKLNTQHKQ